MRTSLLVSIYFLVISCDLAPSEPIPDTEEVIVARLEGVKASIDSEIIDQGSILFLDIAGAVEGPKRLLPIQTDIVCEILKRELHSFSYQNQ